MTTTMLGRGWGTRQPRNRHIRASVGALAALTLIGTACAASPEQFGQARDDTRPTPTTDTPARSEPPVNARPPTSESPVAAKPPTSRPPTSDVPQTSPPPKGDESGTASFQAKGPVSQIGGCEIFPPNHYRNATGIDRLPVHPRSDEWIEGIGGDTAEMRFPRGTTWQGSRAGMPMNIVDSRVTGLHDVEVSWEYSPHAFRGQYPIPSDPLLQGHPTPAWDRHLLMVDVADCTAYELIQFNPARFWIPGYYWALNGAKYPLDDVMPALNTTNAPNMPMIGQYVMRDDVLDGSVDHVMAFCSSRTGSESVWPARRSDGTHGPDAIPMGTWIRLSDRVDPASFEGLARPVVEALRRHGAILTDTCGHAFSLLAENSAEWDDHEVMQLRSLTADDFEVVDAGEVFVDDETYEIR